MSKVFLAILCVLALTSASAASSDELVVIVNPASGVDSMSRVEVSNVFMARNRKLPSGVVALPLDLAGNAPERQRFYSLLLGKSIAEVNSYWARLLFSGRATPPQQMSDASSVIDAVADNKGAIAYVDKSKVDGRVKVVLVLAQ